MLWTLDMNLSRSCLGMTVAVGLAIAAAIPASAQGLQHFAVLGGGNVVSAAGKAKAGDPDGSAAAAITLDRSNTRLCVIMLVQLIDKPTAAALRQGVAGVNGPVVVNLNLPPAGNPGSATTCINGFDSTVGLHVRTRPGDFYLDVRTGPFPGGAIRGQIF